MEIDEIKQRYSVVLEKNRRKIVLNPTFIKDNQHLNKLGVGENLQSIINKAVKEINYTAIDKYYNSELSVAENLKILQDNGVKVHLATLYRYCKDRGIKVCYTDSEIIAMLNANDSVRNNLKTLKDNGVKIGIGRVAKLLKQLKEGNVEESGTVSEGGSNCPQDRVTDTLSSYKTTILLEDAKLETPTQNDIMDDMQTYLMELENEINNEIEKDMELKLTTPSKLHEQRNVGDITEEEREFNNEQDTNNNEDGIRGWKFDFGVFGSNSQSI